MEVIISIDKLLIRQKEIFDAYTENGREIDLLPILKDYGLEDKKVYSIEKGYEYLLMYVTSKNISEEEIKRFNELKQTDSKELFKRGKKAVLSLIKSNGDEQQLYYLAVSLAKLDGRVNPYPISYVKDALNYYLEHSNNKSLIDTYYAVIALTKNNKNKEFNLKLIEEIIKLNNIDTAVNFLRNINIANITLNHLIRQYKILYPANIEELKYLDELINIYRSSKHYKLLPKSEYLEEESTKKLKRILENYLISDVEDIKVILSEEETSEYEFRELLKDAHNSRDPILVSLLDKFHAKNQVINEYRISIITNIANLILNGVNYGNGYRQFNVFDYLNNYHNLNMETIIESVKELYDEANSEYIIKVLNSLDLNPTYNTIEELSSSIGIFSKNGRDLTISEKGIILSYMEEKSMPLNNSIFFAVCERYFDGDLALDNKKLL